MATSRKIFAENPVDRLGIAMGTNFSANCCSESCCGLIHAKQARRCHTKLAEFEGMQSITSFAVQEMALMIWYYYALHLNCTF